MSDGQECEIVSRREKRKSVFIVSEDTTPDLQIAAQRRVKSVWREECRVENVIIVCSTPPSNPTASEETATRCLTKSS